MRRYLLATALASFGLVSALTGPADAGPNLVQNGNFSTTTGALSTLSTTTFSGGEIDDNYIYSGDLTGWSSPNTAPYQGAYNLFFFGLANDKTTNADARFTENGQFLNVNFTGNPLTADRSSASTAILASPGRWSRPSTASRSARPTS